MILAKSAGQEPGKSSPSKFVLLVKYTVVLSSSYGWTFTGLLSGTPNRDQILPYLHKCHNEGAIMAWCNVAETLHWLALVWVLQEALTWPCCIEHPDANDSRSCKIYEHRIKLCERDEHKYKNTKKEIWNQVRRNDGPINGPFNQMYQKRQKALKSIKTRLLCNTGIVATSVLIEALDRCGKKLSYKLHSAAMERSQVRSNAVRSAAWNQVACVELRLFFTFDTIFVLIQALDWTRQRKKPFWSSFRARRSLWLIVMKPLIDWA